MTYVDDILCVGEREALEGFNARMQEEWEVGTPEWAEDGGRAARFLGMEIEKKGGVYRLHQRSYVQSLLEKYPQEKGGSLGNIRLPDQKEKIEALDVQAAQKQTGELLWLAGRTRPDISYAVSLMSQYAVKRPKGVKAIGREVSRHHDGLCVGICTTGARRLWRRGSSTSSSSPQPGGGLHRC